MSYFCFPSMGMAVALRPGDILAFNPREPHAVSSRCHPDDKIICVSMYMKTAVIGLNDNSVQLTPMENHILENYK